MIRSEVLSLVASLRVAVSPLPPPPRKQYGRKKRLRKTGPNRVL